MTKQDIQFINLFEVILDENNYYFLLGKIYRKKKRQFASELFWAFDKRQPISVYGFLDSIEDNLTNRFEDNTDEDIDKLYDLVNNSINDLDREGGWKD